MKTLFLSVIVGILSFSPGIHAQGTLIEDTVLYNQAGELYKNGNFVEALGMYEEIIENGIDNPDLCYNASNAAYRSGLLGNASLYLERAQKLAPSDQDIRANLAFLNTVKQDKEPQQGNVLTAFLSHHYDATDSNSAALWSGISFTLIMFCAIAALFMGGWIRYTAIGFVLLLILIFFLSTGVFVHKVHKSSTVTEAIIMIEEANAFSGPGSENTHIFTIHEGTKVVIERSQDSWNLIRLKSGAGGWIQTEAMEII